MAIFLRFARRPSPDHKAAEAEQGEACRAWGDLRDEIVEIPATTLAGLRLKATIFPDPWDDPDIMQSIVDDIVTVAGDAA